MVLFMDFTFRLYNEIPSPCGALTSECSLLAYTCHPCSCFISEKRKITSFSLKNIKGTSKKLNNIQCCKLAISKIRNIPEKCRSNKLTNQKKLTRFCPQVLVTII